MDRKAALSKVVNGIFERVGEIKQRPRAVAMAKKTLKLAKSKLKTLRVDRPWISNETIAQSETTVNRVYNWLKQKKKSRMHCREEDTPAFTTTDVRNKLSLVQAMWESVLSTRKPYIPKPKTKKKVKKTNETKTETNATAEVESEPGDGHDAETEVDKDIDESANTSGADSGNEDNAREEL